MGVKLNAGPKTDSHPRIRLIARANCVCHSDASTLFNLCLTGKTNERSGTRLEKERDPQKSGVRVMDHKADQVRDDLCGDWLYVWWSLYMA